MKKVIANTLVIALMLSLGTMGASAASAKGQGNCAYAIGNGIYEGYCTVREYVDVDGDGICDNAGNGNCGGRYVDADGDGICDNAGAGYCGNGMGRNFVDTDGDGICDNAGFCQRAMDGTGTHKGFRAGRN